MKVCKKCGKKYSDKDLFCNKCHSLLYFEGHGVSRSKNSISGFYRDWNPPAATTIYSKIYNIPYNKLKYDINKGLYPNGLRTIESKIYSQEYNCSVCSYFVDSNPSYCTLKNKNVDSMSICKSFEPKP